VVATGMAIPGMAMAAAVTMVCPPVPVARTAACGGGAIKTLPGC